MRLGFFLREASRSLRRNAVPSFAALASVLVTMLVLGVFIPVVQATTGAADEVRGRVLLDVYLNGDATEEDARRVAALLRETPHVGNIEFLSKDEAYAQQSKRNPEAYELLGSNPLPDTFRVTPTTPDEIDELRGVLSPATPGGGTTVADPAIEEVRDREEDTAKILSATNAVKFTMAVLALLLIVASVLLISNTIRLSLFARRREVEVMKLVGATDWFIRWPFIIEGIVLGFLGGMLAVALLGVGKVAFLDPLAAQFSLIAAPQTINFALLVTMLLAASVAVSALGSGLSLRRFLRI